jgi:glycerol-3-phosphate dehydrogenase
LEAPDRENYETTALEIDLLFEKHKSTLPTLSRGDVITYFAGIRASTYEEDFVIRKGKWTKNIIHAAGIQSPGLTAAPAIAEDIVSLYQEVIGSELTKNLAFNPIRKSQKLLKDYDSESRNQLILSNPDYGQIICRCEEVSKGEIIDALHRPLEVYTLDGIKRRIRAGMGRCQGGFCQQLIVQIMAQEKKVAVSEVTKKGDGHILLGPTKEDSK